MNTKVDRCFTCGFAGEFAATEDAFKCPDCGETDPVKLDCTRRVCGYLSQPVARKVVKGRHDELRSRTPHIRQETA